LNTPRTFSCKFTGKFDPLITI